MPDSDEEHDHAMFADLAALLRAYAFDILVSELTVPRKVKQTIPTGPPE